MVWFQCESCGENLKKPKLQNHFHGCAARKLSCIDCGVVFDQQSVQAHTSCVTETEKYGPKGTNGAIVSASKKKTENAKMSADIDLTVGLSTCAPWYCSLCNVSATSYETLEGHSQGKKHRAKCKAVQAKMNPPTTVEHSVSVCDIQANGGAAGNGIPGEQEAVSEQTQNLLECKKQSKKRKAGVDSSKTSSTPTEELQETIDKVEDGLERDKGTKKKGKKGKSKCEGDEIPSAVQLESAVIENKGRTPLAEHANGSLKDGDKIPKSEVQHIKAVKWRKLIIKVLAKSPDGVLKTKKLVKEVLPLVGDVELSDGDRKILEAELLTKLISCSKYVVDGKVVRLAKTS